MCPQRVDWLCGLPPYFRYAPLTGRGHPFAKHAKEEKSEKRFMMRHFFFRRRLFFRFFPSARFFAQAEDLTRTSAGLFPKNADAPLGFQLLQDRLQTLFRDMPVKDPAQFVAGIGLSRSAASTFLPAGLLPGCWKCTWPAQAKIHMASSASV